MVSVYNGLKLCLLILILQVNNVFAQSQQYLHLDKIDDYVEIPNASQYIAGSSEVTMAGWYYCDALGYGQGMIAFRNGGSGDGEMYLIQLGDGQVECRFINSGTTYEVVAPAFSVQPETWQHWAWVYNGSTVELFIDAVSVGSAAASGTITSTDTPLALGKHISPWDFYYGGAMDEVTLWSKALTATEIQDIMENELNGDEAGLELYYKFNQGVPGGDNTSITHAISTVEPGVRDGILQNFALNGDASNFLGELDNSFQAISFPQIPNKLITDVPFQLEAIASSELSITYEIMSGPATVSGNTITLDGVVGEVTVKASQPGDGTFDAAEDVINTFQVLDPATFVPVIEARAPLAGDVMVPELGPIQLAAIASIDYPDLFNVNNVEFQIDGAVVEAKDWNNEHYTGWWTPTAYGAYTLNIVAYNNYGASQTETVNIVVVNTASNMTANAGDEVWVNVNVGDEFVEVELPSHQGAFNSIQGMLDITCPPGGCDEWDRISSVKVKGHNGYWYEIIRYITPYGVACNSEIDLSDFMSLLHGKVTMHYNLGTQGNGFEYTLNLDYNAGTPTHKYSAVTALWTDTYDFGNLNNLQPTETINFEFPANTTAAKLKLVSTGHGWGDNNTGNAAEFHDDTHHVHVNGEQTFEQHNWYTCNPNPDNCSPQNGTWFYDRAGWCPGAIAQWFDYDMTPYIGSDAQLKYIFDEDYVDYCNVANVNCQSGVTCANCEDGFNPHLIVSSYLITLGDSPIDVQVSTNEAEKDQIGFSVFPNPSHGLFSVALNDDIQDLNVTVFNNIGQKVVSLSYDQVRNFTIDMSAYPAGFYFVELDAENKTGLKKIILE